MKRSLRSRITIGTLALTACALLAANVTTAMMLRSFLLNRVDESLRDGRKNILRHGTAGLGPSEFVLQLRAEDGTILFQATPQFRDEEYPSPDIPEAVLRNARYPADPLTVGSVDGSIGYRVLVDPLPDGRRLVVAVSMRDVTGTIQRLIAVEALVSLAVLAGLAFLARRVVRVGLRPLEQVEATADAIAAGDLSRRVDETDPSTEVGRLGAALNRMLEQIQAAFAARQRSEERLRQFVADASHELRTPLTSIRGYAELFRQGAHARPDDLAKTMQRIEDEAARMGVLVEDLLLLARLDQGRPLERAPVDLAEIVGDAVEDARAVEPDRPLAFERDGPVIVDGDEGRLRQVIGNLLANVRAHTPAGTPATVTVAVDGPVAALEVADHGPGLEADQIERVFERFYRADQSRARASGGAGLGLSIVAAIARAHGGRAIATSVPGRGARFRVEIPLAVADRAPDAS